MNNKLLLPLLAPLFFSLFFGLAGCSNREDARMLKRDGLREFICKERPYDKSTNTCGERSYWFEADTGLVAYIGVYGISSVAEAKAIADFIAKLKRDNKQDIDISLSIYSAPRSGGRDPKKSKIFQQRL